MSLTKQPFRPEPDETTPFAEDYVEVLMNRLGDLFCPRCGGIDVYVKHPIYADMHQANEIMECRFCLGRDGEPTQWRNVYHFSYIEMTDDPTHRW